MGEICSGVWSEEGDWVGVRYGVNRAARSARCQVLFSKMYKYINNPDLDQFLKKNRYFLSEKNIIWYGRF